jgi:predicted flavoprotein YhiN
VNIKKDVIIIGAGASGLMCAIECGKRGRAVLLLDHADRTGSKIRISGGGRSNFTNLNATSDHYLSGNAHFCKSALARFTPRDILSLVEKHHIAYYEKEEGQMTHGTLLLKLHCERIISQDLPRKDRPSAPVCVRVRTGRPV